MKSLFSFIAVCVMLCSINRVQAQTTLAAGDLVFVGYNSASTTDDDFSFVLLTAVSSGTTINFTDFGWCSGVDITGFQSANPCGASTGAVSDGAITWTATSALPCGTQVRIQCLTTLAASTGTVTGLQASFNNSSQYMSLASGGESIFAFQGTLASPTLIAGLNMNGGWDATLSQCTFSSSFSTLPAALTSFNLVKSPETDNARYDCSTVSALPATLRTAIFNNANWTGTDGTANVYTLPLACTFSCNACTAPSVSAQPPNRTVCAGGNTTFGITAGGTGLTYQWQVNTGSGFTNLSNGAPYSNVTTNTLTITGATAGMSGYLYRCQVTGTCGSATSSSGTLTVSTVTGSTAITNASCFGGANGVINLTPSGGTSPYTYNWGGSITTEDRTGLSAGSYSVTITDANSCTGTVNATVSQPAAAVSGSTIVTNVACFGGANGAINATPTGGTSPYTYNWGGGITTEDRTGLAAGNYSVIITDANGCTGTVNASVTQPSAVSGSTVVTNVSCFGGSNGAINLTPSGGTSPYTFNWGGGVTTEDRTGLASGSYSLTITDANGCTGTVNATVIQPAAAVSGSTVITNVSCFGGSSGTIDLTPSGGTPGYTYSWDGGITTQDRTGLSAGGYSVTITDANGCTGIVNATVTQPTAAVSGSTVVTNVSCFGGSNGAINLTPSGGTSPYTFNWGGGLTTEDRTGLAAGSYSVIATDVNGCTGTVNVSVTEPSVISTATGSQTNATCGLADGDASVTPSGGTAPYTYSWSPSGGTASTATGLAAGTYTVTVTDANGCTATRNYTITEISSLSAATGSQTNVACNGGTTGIASVTPSGGLAPYTYSWSPGSATTSSISGLAAGTYTVTVTDANGCSAIRNYTITQPSAISTATGSQTNVTCNGGATGAASITPGGGTPGYTYSWSPGGATTSSVSALAAGTYTVTVTDANGCTAQRGYTITAPSAISTVTGSQSDVTCNGGSDGAASVSPSGGTPSYTYSWAPSGGTAATATGLVAGTYTVTVTDANGCTATRNYTIGQPSVISTVSGSQTNVSCNGGSNGSATVTPSGGTSPYAYSWSPSGGTAATATGLAAGNYTVTVTDDNGCTATRNYAITQPSVISTTTGSQTNLLCNGATTGSAGVTPSGGTSPYTYLWSPSGGTGATATGLAAGAYTVTVTDANGCIATRNYTLTQPSAINTATGSQTNATCAAANGSASITPSGGTAPYTYSWSPSGGTAATASGLVAGAYTVTVTDANNCTATRIYTITDPGAINTSVGSQTNVSCNGGSNGSASITPSGGTGPYTYSWSPSGGTGATATGLAAGTYTITVTDANGCSATRTYTLTEPPAVSTASGSQTNVLCNGAFTGSATITPSGGTAPYTYLWSPGGVTAATASGLAAGTYLVVVTDASGCQASRFYTITQPSAISTATGSQTDVSCSGASNGSSSVTPSGGVAPYTYSWSPGGATTSSINGLSAGTYTITVTDANNCMATRNYTIMQPAAISTATGSQTNVSCNGGANGAAEVTPSGGTAPYTYSWSPSGGTGATASGLSAGTYTVSVTDANGCIATRNYTITQPTAISTVVGSQMNVSCNGGSNGTTSITPSGGTAPYTYSWSPGGGTGAAASGLAAGTYTVTVTDANGCIATRDYTIAQPPVLSTTGSQSNVLCNGGSTGTATVIPSGGTVPYTYSWSPSGGTAATATGLTVGIYTVTVTDANSCQVTRIFTITQPPVLGATTSQTNIACNGAATGVANVTPSGGTPPYTYSWSPSGGTAATATGLTAGNYTVTVTDGNGCAITRNFTITQSSAINLATGSQTNVSCIGGTNGGASVSPSGGVSPYTYSWSPSGGTGATASGLSAGTYTVSVTDANGCATTRVYIITQPAAIAAYSVTGGGAYCTGGAGVSIGLSGSETGVNYQLFNGASAVGSAVAGTGSAISFGNQTAIGTYTVVATNTTTNCQATMTGGATISINPTPNVNAVSSQTLCNGATTSVVNFSGSVPGTTFSWTNNTTTIGLAAGGTGNIGTFAATNTGAVPVTATITVVPSASGCIGAAGTFTITVNPTPTVNVVSNQTLCNGASTAAINIGGSAVSGTSYNWINSSSAIGLAASGAGNIASFSAINIGTTTVVATITVTPSANGCGGPVKTFTIAVNPTPTVNTVSSQVLCNGAPTTAVNFTGDVTGSTFNWTNNTPSIGLATNGSGNIASFTAINATTVPIAATITVTPSANGCTGPIGTFTITVNPTPTVNTLSSQIRCNGAGTTAVNFSGSVSGTTYAWTNNTPSIGLAASGVGSIASFTAVNLTSVPVNATMAVTPSANGCAGTTGTFTITVNPTPTVAAVTNQAICGGSNTTPISFAGGVGGTTFAWVNSNTSIGLAASGSGNIASFAGINVGAVPEVAVVTVLPTANGCDGPFGMFTITVNPIPSLTSTQAAPPICNNTQFNYTPTSATPGATFAWSRAAVAGISNAAATGANNPAEVLVNTTPNPIVVTYMYILSANACSNTVSVTVTVNPTPKLTSPLSAVTCGDDAFSYTPTSLTAGAAYAWTRAGVAGITPATGNGAGSINETLTNNTSSTLMVTYVYLLTANGCINTENVVLTVNPRPLAPVITIKSPDDLCSQTRFQNFGAATPAPTGASYTWTATNAVVWAQSANEQYALVNFPYAGESEVILTTTIAGTGCDTSVAYIVEVGSQIAQQPEIIYHNGRFVCLQHDMDSYRWGYDDKVTLDSTIAPNQTNQDYLNLTPDLNNKYYWVITTKGNCLQKSYYNQPTGVSAPELKVYELIVYPNPATDLVNIEFDVVNTEITEVAVFDMAGKLLSKMPAGNGKLKLDVSSFAQGFYTVSCAKDGLKIVTAKFIKE